MLRHEFQPGKLVTGLFLTAAGAVYAGDAAGLWNTPWFVAVPLVAGGLLLAGVTAAVTQGVRRRRGAENGRRAQGLPDAAGRRDWSDRT